jgi:UDP-N-acetylglucosamine--N-acetylmuramyl-(pentapeptide) pyrophosphoryl-undecaprenol N-acetylglucosamine transferase
MSNVIKPLVGLYIHDRPGPVGRARAIVPRLTSRVALFRSGAPDPLFDDIASVSVPPPPPHAVPVVDGCGDAVLGPGLAARLSRWVEEEEPALLLVDGSLDVALLGRLIGVPVVPVRRPFAGVGAAAGAVHELAAAWLAPFPAALEPVDTPPEIRRRTVHAGFVSRFEGRRLGQRAARRRIGVPEDARHVTVIAGSEGLSLDAAAIETASAAASAWTFSVLGPCSGVDSASSRVRFEGWCDDVFPHLVAADVVIASASCSAIADVAAAGRPLALVPGEDAEGQVLAGALEELGAAVVLDGWPSAIAWPALLADLLDLPTRPLRSLADGRASRRAARWIDAWAVSPPADPTEARAMLRSSGGRNEVPDPPRVPVPEPLAAVPEG